MESRKVDRYLVVEVFVERGIRVIGNDAPLRLLSTLAQQTKLSNSLVQSVTIATRIVDHRGWFDFLLFCLNIWMD